MANTRTRHALVFVLAAMGSGCAPRLMPLPMLAAWYSPTQASASHAAAPTVERTATGPSAQYPRAR